MFTRVMVYRPLRGLQSVVPPILGFRCAPPQALRHRPLPRARIISSSNDFLCKALPCSPLRLHFYDNPNPNPIDTVNSKRTCSPLFHLILSSVTAVLTPERAQRYMTHGGPSGTLAEWLAESPTLSPERYSGRTAADCDRLPGTRCSGPAP